MSESKEHFYRDFSKFDEMSTEELNEILRQDSQLPDGEDSDTDAILYIMGVIAKRNQELPSSDFGDVNHAWSSFNKNYRFASSEGCSLFDFDDEPQLNGTSDKTQILRPAPRSNTRPRKWVLRTARILAAVIAVLLATSLTAYLISICGYTVFTNNLGYYTAVTSTTFVDLNFDCGYTSGYRVVTEIDRR